MTGMIIGGAFLSLFGLGGFFLGLMFSIASGGASSRLVPGLIMLVVGGGLLVFGLRFLVRGLKGGAKAVDQTIKSIAAKYNGEIREDIFTAEAGRSEEVAAQLQRMLKTGEASRKEKDGVSWLLFPAFHFTLKTKYCPYCGRDYPVREEVETCPTCGGDLKIKEEGSSDGDSLFSLDT